MKRGCQNLEFACGQKVSLGLPKVALFSIPEQFNRLEDEVVEGLVDIDTDCIFRQRGVPRASKTGFPKRAGGMKCPVLSVILLAMTANDPAR
jgi:hypothetical protein